MSRGDTACRDCGAETLSAEPGVPTEYYMVHDHIWRAAHMRRGILCIGCLETRLGRTLHRGDFTTAMLNDLNLSDCLDYDGRPGYAWSYRSDRLRDRLRDAGTP